jgi:hypothetical protein
MKIDTPNQELHLNNIWTKGADSLILKGIFKWFDPVILMVLNDKFMKSIKIGWNILLFFG